MEHSLRECGSGCAANGLSDRKLCIDLLSQVEPHSRSECSTNNAPLEIAKGFVARQRPFEIAAKQMGDRQPAPAIAVGTQVMRFFGVM